MTNKEVLSDLQAFSEYGRPITIGPVLLNHLVDLLKACQDMTIEQIAPANNIAKMAVIWSACTTPGGSLLEDNLRVEIQTFKLLGEPNGTN